MKSHPGITVALIVATASGLLAQAAPPIPRQTPAETVTMEAFTVTGTNIKRLDQEKSLPVTIISADDIEARDAATPMNLLESIAFITDFPENETPTNAIAGRGDNANIALRGLGAGNTLVLLNGRRMPFHPFTTGAVSPLGRSGVFAELRAGFLRRPFPVTALNLGAARSRCELRATTDFRGNNSRPFAPQRQGNPPQRKRGTRSAANGIKS